jgi:hypothetical protein
MNVLGYLTTWGERGLSNSTTAGAKPKRANGDMVECT